MAQMSLELPLLTAAPPRDAAWLRAARRARWLSWLSLAWMTVEGVVGLLAGAQANSISLITWAASSAVEGLASAIVIWRFTGTRTLSATAERRAQRWVAGSFFLLAPYFVFEAVRRLLTGEAAETHVLAIAVTATSMLGMPLLGIAKRRLGRRLDSGATAGEGAQNLLCAAQAAVALIAVATAGALPWLDPVAALVIAALALREGRGLWRGQDSCCTQGCCASLPSRNDRSAALPASESARR
jgi:divalent metal cation (Fe/Co/Zn/Cd) transporter